DGGLDQIQQRREMSELHVVAGALDGPAVRVAEHDEQAGAGELAGELHAAQHRLAEDVSSDAHAEDVPEPLVEDELGRRARVDAAQDRGKGPLPVTRLVDLLEEVAVGLEVPYEPVVALLQIVK